MGRSKATTRKGRHSCEPSAETGKGGRFHTPRRKGLCSTEYRLTLHGASGDTPRSIKHSPFRQGFASLAAEPRKTYKPLLNYTIKKGTEPLCTRLSTDGSGEYRRIQATGVFAFAGYFLLNVVSSSSSGKYLSLSFVSFKVITFTSR